MSFDAVRPAPLFLTAREARCGIDGTDWAGLGLGRDTFRRWVRTGRIPSIVDEDSNPERPYRYYSRLALEAWALRNGAPTEKAS